MSNELKNTNPAGLPTAGGTINQHGQKIYNVGHAENVSTGNITNVILPNQQSGSTTATFQNSLSNEYYNLFVIGGEIFTPFSQGHFIVPKERALTENVSSDIVNLVNSLSDKAIETIKTFPALFADENRMYARADNSQYAAYGFVTNVVKQDNGIKVYYQALNAIPQQELNEIAFNLAIQGTSAFNELNRTHWTIKKINLVEELRDAGISVLAFT